MLSAMSSEIGVVEVRQFGVLPDGTTAQLFTLRSEQLEVTLTDFGARLVSVLAPDREGKRVNVVLGFDSLESYLVDRSTFAGAIVGRYGNRLAHGQFTVDGKRYQVPLNNGQNSLHGGPEGFDRYVWRAQPVAAGVEFTLLSPDGDQGFPGALTLTARYTLEALRCASISARRPKRRRWST